MSGNYTFLPYHLKSVNPDLYITLMDIWFCYNSAKICRQFGIPYVMYYPIDGKPFYHGWENVMNICHTPLAMSKFGAEVTQDYYKDHVMADEFSVIPYIHHGVDTDVFKPAASSKKLEMRKELTRLQWGDPDELFVMVCVNRNVLRKNYPGMYRGIVKFLNKLTDKERKNVKLIQKTGATVDPKLGYDLNDLMNSYGIQDNVLSMDIEGAESPHFGLTFEEMANAYRSADVNISATMAEGFGLSTIESKACGVPSIITDYTTSRELVDEDGWLVPVGEYVTSAYNVQHGLVDTDAFGEALYDAWLNRDKVKKFGDRGAKRALDFSWDIIAERFIKLFGGIL